MACGQGTASWRFRGNPARRFMLAGLDSNMCWRSLSPNRNLQSHAPAGSRSRRVFFWVQGSEEEPNAAADPSLHFLPRSLKSEWRKSLAWS